MAVSRMAARNEDAVGTLLEGAEDHQGAHPPSAGKADHPHIGWVLETSGARHVGAGIAAPVADQGDDVWLPAVGDRCRVAAGGGGDGPEDVLSGLAEATTYYWQVRAGNTSGSVEADGGEALAILTGKTALHAS